MDIVRGDLGGDIPRLWLSGGAGAWHISEDVNGGANARILDGTGIAEDSTSAASFGPLATIESIEATRRGLFVVSGGRLAALLRPMQAPWTWDPVPLDRSQLEGIVVGIGGTSLGQLYVAMLDDRRVHIWLGSGLGEWRHLASASTIGARDTWFDMVVSPEGDALFWGGGLIAAFHAKRRRLVVRQAPAVAPLPRQLAARIRLRPAGSWRGWRPNQPLLVACSDDRLGLLRWVEGTPILEALPTLSSALLAAVCAEGAVLGRAGDKTIRIASGEDGVATVREGAAAEVSDAGAARTRDGAAFIVSRGEAIESEFVSARDRTPQVRDTLSLGRFGAWAPSGPGFEPLAICTYTAQAQPRQQVWISLDPSEARGTDTLQRILRIRLQERRS